MIDRLRRVAATVQYRVQTWRQSRHRMDESTMRVLDEAVAAFETSEEVHLEDVTTDRTARAAVRTAFRDLEARGYVTAVRGEPNTWRRGPVVTELTALSES